jgi:hypothetical protein
LDVSILDEFARGRASMRLLARLSLGNVMLCTGNGDVHSFLVRRLGLSVECPTCGQVALSVDLLAEFYRPPKDAIDVPFAPLDDEPPATPSNVIPLRR